MHATRCLLLLPVTVTSVTLSGQGLLADALWQATKNEPSSVMVNTPVPRQINDSQARLLIIMLRCCLNGADGSQPGHDGCKHSMQQLCLCALTACSTHRCSATGYVC